MRKLMRSLITLILVSTFMLNPALADNPQPRKIYSGWLPYYALKTSLPATLNNIDLMREVMPFWYTLKYNGTKASITDLYTPANPSVPISQTLTTLKSAGLLIIPTITDGTDKLVLANLINTEAGRAMAVDAIVSLVTQNNFDGIDLDFENFAFVDGNTSWDSTKPNWILFVKLLSSKLHEIGKLLSITSPYALDPTSGKKGYYVYAWAEIAPVIDRLRIMTYDYSVANPGPIGPIAWTENTVKYATSIMPASKVFVGLAGYGRDWVVKVDGVCPSDVAKTITPSAKAATFIMSNAATLAAGYGATITYNEAFQEATFTYQKTYNGNTATGLATTCTATRTAWYQDARAYQARAQLVSKYRLGGLVAWTIGFEDQQAMTNIRNLALTIAPDQVVSMLSSDFTIFKYGQPITLSGLFTLADKSPVPALPVHLEVKRSDESNWRELSAFQTGVDGKVSVQLYLGQNQSVRLRSDGSWERLEGISNQQDVNVIPQIKISSPSRVLTNSKFTITGTVTPGNQISVNLERFDGKWKSIGSTITDSNGGYSFQVTSTKEPFIKLRVTANGGTSAAVTISVL